MITYINYTDLGDYRTPKGPETFHIATALHKEGLLDKVYVRGRFDQATEFDDKIITMGNFIPKVKTAIGKYMLKGYDGRESSQMGFDTRVAKHINGGTIFLGVAGLPICASKADKLIIFTPSSHPLSFKKVWDEETEVPYKLTYLEKANCETYKKADLILARSPFNKQTLVDNGVDPNKIKIIWNGINLDRFNMTSRINDKFRVLFVANSGLLKGLKYLLEAWATSELKNKKDAELVIAGFMKPDVQKIIKQYSNVPGIKYVGQVDPVPYYQQCSVFVLPSLMEGSPVVLLEAMACGAPTISFENTGSPATKESGFILPNRDIKALKEKLEYLYHNQDVAIKMGLAAAAEAKEFDYNNYTKRIIGFIKEVL